MFETIETSSVALFGELCGGKYPHKGVPEEPHTRPVQTGVWYNPVVEFVLFDIGLAGVSGRCFMAFKTAACPVISGSRESDMYVRTCCLCDHRQDNEPKSGTAPQPCFCKCASVAKAASVG